LREKKYLAIVKRQVRNGLNAVAFLDDICWWSYADGNPGVDTSMNPKQRTPPKISKSILDFAGDFIRLGETLEDRQNRLNAACSAWNMACNTSDLRKKHLDQYVRGYGKFNPDADAEHLANVRKDMEQLIEVKLTKFPNDLRQIVSARIMKAGNQERIEAAAARLQ
jgi:hypothetical protein